MAAAAVLVEDELSESPKGGALVVSVEVAKRTDRLVATAQSDRYAEKQTTKARAIPFSDAVVRSRKDDIECDDEDDAGEGGKGECELL